MIYKTWLDVNFLHHIKYLPDCFRELFEFVEVERNDSMDCCRFIVELKMLNWFDDYKNFSRDILMISHHVMCAGVLPLVTMMFTTTLRKWKTTTCGF